MNRELKMINTPKVLVALLAALLLFAAPAQVFAAAGDPTSDPTASQYENPGSTVTQESPDDSEVTVVTTSGSDDDSSGSLPFTGFDAGVLAIVALLLGATGLALRRLSAVK